jgi:ubiquinone/menaquinone biosynthesis C-methylase UbiE
VKSLEMLASRAHNRRTAENSAAYLLPHLRPGLAVLDIGCGPGTITADIAARVAPASVTAVEVSGGVLGLARAEAAARGRANIEFIVSDVQALAVASSTLDLVHAHQVRQARRRAGAGADGDAARLQ